MTIHEINVDKTVSFFDFKKEEIKFVSQKLEQ